MEHLASDQLKVWNFFIFAQYESLNPPPVSDILVFFDYLLI